MNRYLSLICCVGLLNFSYAQADDFEEWGQRLQYADKSYFPEIQSVFLHRMADDRSFPAIQFSSRQKLLLEFDDLIAAGTNFNYTVIHCNADWTPSSLNKSEYLYGYQDHFISDLDFSFNTFVPYTHYRLTIPNEQMKFTKSGNYLLVVYEDDVNYPILTRRFLVYEDFVSAAGMLQRPSRVEYRDNYQEIDFVLMHSGYDIPDPFQNFQVALLQNQQWNSAITTLRPRFIQVGKLDYNYDKENLFLGGNEWRNFDTKDERNLSMNVRRIELDTNFTYYLQTEFPRTISRYSTEFDINGQRVIRSISTNNPAIEADYVWVDFELKMQAPSSDQTFYVYGALSDWQIQPRFRLKYDYNSNSFRARILLKQGYYNYAFVGIADDGGSPDFELIEGNHWETENTYQLIIYHREIGIRYDRVVGYATFSSDDIY